ncbi:hypothetical protein QBC40DRAFT_264677 [Triangularia verruculosa]|uniref:Uncharacterized protein n=1 Tax=Triangularia verruculosa TaxID=2587418 RepID=A0AAN6XHP6_9PEZI|nr:hypothetical protein QBC40DRAFT_264677 [Triangularia verruculosa]
MEAATLPLFISGQSETRALKPDQGDAARSGATGVLLTTLLGATLHLETADAALFYVPSPKNYARRALAQVRVVKNHDNIEGGQSIQYEDGSCTTRDRAENQVSSTLSIPLTQATFIWMKIVQNLLSYV